jgi:hypothetical protein
MEAAIGKAAGRIWDILHDNGKASVAQLPKLVGEKDVVTYQALGWLAREGKISYRTEGNRTFVALK